MIGPTWSSCSRYVPFYQTGAKPFLAVLNTALEPVASFHDRAGWYSSWRYCVSAWAWNSTLTVAAKPYAPCSLDVCWHPSDPNPRLSAAAEIAGVLLEGICTREEVLKLAWSPDQGLAAVTRIPE